jgi:hypothetical protein
MLSTVDGAPDKFQIKIWELATEGVIYDNQLGETDDAVVTTAIEGGSIVIHKKLQTAQVNAVERSREISAGLIITLLKFD